MKALERVLRRGWMCFMGLREVVIGVGICVFFLTFYAIFGLMSR